MSGQDLKLNIYGKSYAEAFCGLHWAVDWE
jgi:hypothetical protein